MYYAKSQQRNIQTHHEYYPQQVTKQKQGSLSVSCINQTISRNNLIFSIAMILLQIGICLIYGFVYQIPHTIVNSSSVVFMVLLAFVVIAGFGLLFGYNPKLFWTGMGFNLLIAALCIQIYPLYNGFWTRTAGFNYIDLGTNKYNIYLTDRQAGTSNIPFHYYGNSLANALKCALAVIVAYSAILGRSSQLQCLIVILLGAFGFQLNRKVVQGTQGNDAFGTYIIFSYGGWMGLGLGIFQLLRTKIFSVQPNNNSLNKYTATKDSSVHSFTGAIIIFILLPVLSYMIDGNLRYSSYNVYTNPICLYLGMVGGGIFSAGISCLSGKLIARDLTHGMLAGAIATGASAQFITAPVYALVAGSSGGIVQALIQNCLQMPAAKKGVIISTISWSVFGIQGIIGGAFASGWTAVRGGQPNNIINITSPTLRPYNQILASLISAGIGLGFGIGTSLFILLVNRMWENEYYQDFYYWCVDDGIRDFELTREETQQSFYEDDIEISVPSDQDMQYGAYL